MATSTRSPSPVTLLALALGAFSLYGIVRPGGSESRPTECTDVEPGCPGAVPSTGTPVAPTVDAETVCRNAGYLCAELGTADRMVVQRWRVFEGPLVVHVPRPEHEDPGVAVRLQQAAARGIGTWNDQPFPVLVDLHGDRDPHFSVVWRPTLSGSNIGVARTRWSPNTGLSVHSIELATRNPYAPGQLADPAQIRLTAAHEMGHALGLGHSDRERDVMYPTNTAGSVSARDRRTMEALYALTDGTTIVR